MNRLRYLTISVMASLAFAMNAAGQISVTALGSGGAYTENFSILGTTDFPLTNNTSIPGVYAFRGLGNTIPNIFVADDGSSAAGEFKNYGSIGSADRAMGSLATASTETLQYGFRFQNDTVFTIASMEITYTCEQWRDASTAPHQLQVEYQVSAGNITNLITGTYTAVPALTCTSPLNTGVGAIDGNSPANRVVVNAGFPITIPPLSEVMIRFTDVDEVGVDHGLAVDDLRVVFRRAPTAADGEIRGRVLSSNGRGISGVRMVLTGGELDEPKTAITNAFGYFSFNGVEAGRLYLVTVSSKRHRFAEATRTVELLDSAFDVDFVALP